MKARNGKLTVWNEQVNPSAWGEITLWDKPTDAETVRMIATGTFPAGLTVALLIDAEQPLAWQQLGIQKSQLVLDAAGPLLPFAAAWLMFKNLEKGQSFAVDTMALYEL